MHFELFMTTLGVFVISYVSLIFSDYFIHKYIWHGRIRKLVPKLVWNYLCYPQYVHHFVAHHRHAADFKNELLSGEGPPHEALEEMEENYPQHMKTLACTNHGITIRRNGTFRICILYYWSLLILTPHLYVAILIGWFLSPAYFVFSILLFSLPTMTQIHHAFYHMDDSARRRHSPRYLRWFFLSKEFDDMAVEHRKHHYDSSSVDKYYSVLPFGNKSLRLLGLN